ncbi:GNAT family N-acetyltransferase [Amphiplicatus metriothermophilus]|uniref:Aminoglycoside 6'-N-acetyltransferase n=1 Tax=Amphiplicatus metriothermophilus TaxID=1519374 RepID=A0A239PKH2_9PROT|nr:GNAT family N-acetyltransferase [Amphiplicatus metriothermophilus]MBB5517528.1 aminoglycoside 6'-N-acetyltransferase [Amphiplicatus metriothermophilus]SNT68137.1 aminoglycoside 6'-N-acetyltransferase [Amphiplicatus metriothermophilus]
MPGSITWRKARPDDARFLERWDEDPDVIASNPNDVGRTDWRAEIERNDPFSEILIFEEDGRPVGVVCDIDPALEETHYWGDCESGLRALDIWIGEARDRGRGVGAQMMRLALARAFADPAVRAVIIDPLASNARAIRFYERIGFRPVERRRFGEDDCLVMRFDRPA